MTSRTWVGVRLGRACRRSAASPATCGAAMLVPEAVAVPPGSGGTVARFTYVPVGVPSTRYRCPAR